MSKVYQNFKSVWITDRKLERKTEQRKQKLKVVQNSYISKTYFICDGRKLQPVFPHVLCKDSVIQSVIYQAQLISLITLPFHVWCTVSSTSHWNLTQVPSTKCLCYLLFLLLIYAADTIHRISMNSFSIWKNFTSENALYFYV